jgi:hypothetical protein
VPNDNISAFNASVVTILARLYGAFPSPSDLDAIALAQESAAPPLVVADTLRFLAAEQYIRIGAEEDSDRLFFRVVLTSLGLSALNAIPDSLKPQHTVGQRFIELVRDGGRGLFKAASQQTIAAELPTLLRHLGF